MWNVDSLVASDDNGNLIVLMNGVLTLYVVTDSLHISKKIKLDETPPCLSVVIDDLLKWLADEQRIST